MKLPSDNAINVDSLEVQNSTKAYKIKVGEKINFATRVHGSVGMAAEYEIQDEKILKLDNSEIIYDNPNFEGTGGDAATRYFIFKGISKGKTKVTIKKIFRGELQKEIVLEVEVI
ncbi:hypothetical protein [Bernardetia litoralis]|nr:hypothetical protein [Bernardetia litoralis]